MAIKGLTHDADGRVIQRLSVKTKVAVGLPADTKQGRKAPMKLDFFIFQRKSNKGEGLNATWEIDPELTKHYGDSPREIDIILLDDDLENVFPTQFAWWTQTQCTCHGDGETAIRRTKDHPDGETWQPCGKMCPDLEAGRCKPSGDLRFMLADFPQFGAIARLHTTSYRSVQQLYSSLQQILMITGGRLAGIRLTLVVRPEKTSYTAADGGKRSTIVPALSLEMKADGVKKLVGKMIENARLFEQTRKLLGPGKVQVVEDEAQIAPEFSREFYHEVEEDEREAAKPTRRERERGTLEVSPQQNRGHHDENLNPGKPTKIEVLPPESTRAEKTEPDKPVKQPAKFEEIKVSVVKIDPKMKDLTAKQLEENAQAKANNATPPHDRIPYYVLQTEEHGRITVWDSKLHPAILKSQKKQCVFLVSKNSRGWVTLEEIVEIGGMKFSRDPETRESLPKEALEMTQRASERMEAGGTAAPQSPAPVTPSVRELTGKVKEFRNADEKGNLYKKSGKPYVTIRLEYLPEDNTADVHNLFICANPALCEFLDMTEGEEITFLYSSHRNAQSKVNAQVIEDIKKIGNRRFEDGRPVVEDISHESGMSDENQDVHGLAGLFDE